MGGQRFERAASKVLTQEVQATAGARLSDLRSETVGQERRVVATVVTPAEFEAQQVEEIEVALRREVSPSIRLVVRSLLSKDFDSRGPAYTGEDEAQPRETVAERAAGVLNENLKRFPGARLVELRSDGPADRITLTAVVRTPRVLVPADVGTLQAELSRVLDQPARLIVRSAPVVEVDAEKFLHGSGEPAAAGSPANDSPPNTTPDQANR